MLPPEPTLTDRLLLDQLADKWTILVLGAFCPVHHTLRFNELKRRVPGISQKTLTQCLRRLERNGILERHVVDAAPIAVTYTITPLGFSLREPVKVLQAWTETHQAEVQAAQARFDARQREGDPLVET